MEDESGELGSSSTKKPTTFAEYADEMCAYYMALGVPYHEYWHGNYAQLQYYAKADELKRDRENWLDLRQGSYVYDALCAASPILHAFAPKGTKPHPYHKLPYGVKEQIDPEVAKAEFLAKWKADKAIWKARYGK